MCVQVDDDDVLDSQCNPVDPAFLDMVDLQSSILSWLGAVSFVSPSFLLVSTTLFRPAHGFMVVWQHNNHRFCLPTDISTTIRQPSSSSTTTRRNASPYLSADTLYFDIAVGSGNNNQQELGRLVFRLAIPSPLPLHAENVIQLAQGSRRSIDSLAHYVGCEFDYGLDYILEDNNNSGRYRWSHVLRGRGRNGVGPPDGILTDPEHQLQCTHSVYGGQYYGIQYEPSNDSDAHDANDIFLTVQVAGPGRGSSRFQIVRVGESPREWGERLLLNSGVIGKLVEGHETLRNMARQHMGPPKIIRCGVMDE